MADRTLPDSQLQTIKDHPDIQRLIRDNQEVAQLDPWTVAEVYEAVDHLVGLALDLDDHALFSELLAHFNGEEFSGRPMTALEKARQRWGLEA